jgi:hypothetical protein
MTMPDDSFLQGARRIRHAGSCADIASALLLAVASGSPGSPAEWQRRAGARAALECVLRRLELTIVRTGQSSPESASDLRIRARRELTRLASAVSGLALSELSGYADVAVSAAADLARATEAMARAAVEEAAAPCAYVSLGGNLFMRASVRPHGIPEDRLEAILLAVAEPLRRACESSEAGSLGRLHLRRDFPDLHLSLRATLDTSTSDTPLIRIELADPAQPEENAGEIERPEPDQGRFCARLLRAVVN